MKNCDFSGSTDRIFKIFFLSERASGVGSTFVSLIKFRFFDRSGYRFTFARNFQIRVIASGTTTERDRRIFSSDQKSLSKSPEQVLLVLPKTSVVPRIGRIIENTG